MEGKERVREEVVAENELDASERRRRELLAEPLPEGRVLYVAIAVKDSKDSGGVIVEMLGADGFEFSVPKVALLEAASKVRTLND
ncbi:MAG TPA: hypothetical protein VNP04_27045 [Alphaproteobacteria bacterium]|nr:hypothetical protein [Alphaproteobacteria bacterium]